MEEAECFGIFDRQEKNHYYVLCIRIYVTLSSLMSLRVQCGLAWVVWAQSREREREDTAALKTGSGSGRAGQGQGWAFALKYWPAMGQERGRQWPGAH